MHKALSTLNSLHKKLQHKSITMMEDASSSIPVMRKPADAMTTGLNSSNLAAAAMQRHPIDRMQRGELAN